MTTAAIVDGSGLVTNVIVADANIDVIPGYILVNYAGLIVVPGFTYNSITQMLTNGVVSIPIVQPVAVL